MTNQILHAASRPRTNNLLLSLLWAASLSLEWRDSVPAAKMPPKGKRGRPKKGEEKKQRKKKDPNAPKRPMSAYFLFMNATRPTVRKETPDASIGEVAKILGKMWGEIDPSDKAKFDKEAAAAKKKWEVEK